MTKIVEIVNKNKKNTNTQHNTNTQKNIIVFDKVSKFYDKKKVLDNLSFTIQEGSITSLIGASGIGKTTTIRIINGLEEYNDGKVIIDGIILNKKTTKQVRKKTAFVFQQFNLFPNMSVLKNITYTPINVYKLDKDKVEKEARALLKQFNLGYHSDRYPHELSGGQKQRVAIIRALILKPKILIMDEPTASLDTDLIKEIITIIKNINKELGLTIVIVSHDMFFVNECSDKIIKFEKDIRKNHYKKINNLSHKNSNKQIHCRAKDKPAKIKHK